MRRVGLLVLVLGTAAHADPARRTYLDVSAGAGLIFARNWTYHANETTTAISKGGALRLHDLFDTIAFDIEVGWSRTSWQDRVKCSGCDRFQLLGSSWKKFGPIELSFGAGIELFDGEFTAPYGETQSSTTWGVIGSGAASYTRQVTETSIGMELVVQASQIGSRPAQPIIRTALARYDEGAAAYRALDLQIRFFVRI